MSNPVGRPLKFKSVEELEEQIELYFSECEELDKPLTITGLCLALNCDRKTLLNYENKDEYFHTIQKAKMMVENYLEMGLYKGGNTAGVIFNLKNNFGWKDKVETEHTGNFSVSSILASLDHEKPQLEDKAFDVEYEKILDEGLE